MKKQHSYLNGDDISEREMRESEETLANDHLGIDAEKDELFDEFRTDHGASSFLLQTGRNVKGKVVGSATPQVVRTSNRSLQIGLPALALLTLVSALVFWPETQQEQQIEPQQNNSQIAISTVDTEQELAVPQPVIADNEIHGSELSDAEIEIAEVVQSQLEIEVEDITETLVEQVEADAVQSNVPEEQPAPTVQAVQSLEEKRASERQRVGIQIVNPSLASEEQTLRESIAATQSREEKMDLYLQLARLHLDKQDFGAAADSFLKTVALANELKATEFKRNALEECVVVWEQAGTRAASIALAKEAVNLQNISESVRTKAQETIDSSKK